MKIEKQLLIIHAAGQLQQDQINNNAPVEGSSCELWRGTSSGPLCHQKRIGQLSPGWQTHTVPKTDTRVRLHCCRFHCRGLEAKTGW